MKTRSFHITRLQLAYLASEEYVRSLWWFALSVPSFGIIMMVTGGGILKVMGLTAILWPISIPARAIVSSSKASQLFTGGCYAGLDAETLTFYDTSETREKPLRWQVPLIRVRDVVERRQCYVVRMRKLGFVAIPLSAFATDEDRANFVRIIAHAIEDRYAKH